MKEIVKGNVLLYKEGRLFGESWSSSNPQSLQATLSKDCLGYRISSSFCMHVFLGSSDSRRSSVHSSVLNVSFRDGSLVGALSLDVTWLLALVASTLVVVLNWAVS